MGNRIIVAVGLILGLAAATAQAGTNSWNTGNAFWDLDGAWSLNAFPTITDVGDFITNASSKTATIDAFVDPSSLTISNLTVSGIGGATNTLFLKNANAGTNGPLHILNGMTISSAGVLQITNSFVQVDGISGGAFVLSGSMRILGGAKVVVNTATVTGGAVLQYALGTISSSVVVSNNLTLAATLNVTDGGGFTNTTYTLFTYGGALTYNGLTIGTTPTNSSCVVDTNTAGQVNLVVTLTSPPPPTSTFQITSVARNTSDVVITWNSTVGKTNAVQAVNGGTMGYSTNGFLDISGSIIITSSATTNYVDSGGATNIPSRFYRVRLVP